jgi:hypothetical protein
MEKAPEAPLTCRTCRTGLPPEIFNTAAVVACPTCRTPTLAAVFPAAYRAYDAGRPAEAVLTDGEAGCFYHQDKKAVIACEGCGRFLCGLCDVSIAGQHLCPGCIETGKKKGRLPQIGKHRLLYDDIALAVAILPLLIWFVTCITAPIAIYLVVRHWKSPGSLVRRGKGRFVLAFIFAGLELTGWCALAIGLLMH